MIRLACQIPPPLLEGPGDGAFSFSPRTRPAQLLPNFCPPPRQVTCSRDRSARPGRESRFSARSRCRIIRLCRGSGSSRAWLSCSCSRRRPASWPRIACLLARSHQLSRRFAARSPLELWSHSTRRRMWLSSVSVVVGTPDAASQANDWRLCRFASSGRGSGRFSYAGSPSTWRLIRADVPPASLTQYR